jgi:hypothetical protein
MAGKKKREPRPQIPNTKSRLEILPDDQHAHTVETLYGTIVYTYSPKIMRGILGGIFTTLLGRAYYNKPLNLQKLFERPESEPPYEYLHNRYPELLAENEEYSEHAFKLLSEQASTLLIEASEQLIQEVIFRTLRELEEEGPDQLYSMIPELLKLLTSDIIERVKIRVNAPTRGGRKKIWTQKQKEAYLVVYEDACKAIKHAKKIYSQNQKSKKWKAMVLAAYPLLTNDIIDLLPGRGVNSQPGVLAHKYAAKLFNAKGREYLKQVVKTARKRRREKGTMKRAV